LDWREHGQGPETAALLEQLSLHIQQERDSEKESSQARKGKQNEPFFDVILVADCVYFDELYRPLIDTLVPLAGETTKIVICNDDGRTAAKAIEATTGKRWDEEFFSLFFQQFQKEEDHFFEQGSLLPLSAGGPFRLVVAQKRKDIKEGQSRNET
jgi:hypothetical protein